MSVNLCIDWGNTNVKAAIFENDVLKKSYAIPQDDILVEIAKIIDTQKPDNAILCAVVDDTDQLAFLLKESVKTFIKMDGSTSTPIYNAYATPETLGADRLALVTAAYTQFPDKNNLVISAGTCVTYNHIQKTKTFRGGAISPGLHMRFKAMHDYTNKLPEVEAEGDLVLLGYDTETSLRSGVVFGMTAEIDGMINEYEKKYPDFNAILTGGDAPFFADKIKSKIFADPDLLLKGLNIIIRHNA
jgi:type III pantothenate kinase